MSIVIIIAKVLLSIFLLGFIIGGISKLSTSHRNQDINPTIEYFVGAFGLVVGLVGIYLTWFN